MRTLKPCGDRILIRLKQVEEKSAGGIVLARETVERNKYGTEEAYVVALGPDAFLGLGSGEPRCAVGDLVKVTKYSGAGDETIEDGQVYKIISDEDVLGVYEGEGL